MVMWQQGGRATASLFRWTYGFINRLVMAGDIFGFIVTGLVSPWLAEGHGHRLTTMQGLLLAAIQAAVFVTALRAIAAYRLEKYGRLWLSLGGVGFGLVCSWLIGAGFVANFIDPLYASTELFIIFPLLQLAVFTGLRIVARVAFGRIDRLALMRRNTIIIGCGEEADAIVRHLADPEQASAYNIIGVVSDADQAAPGLFAGRPLLGGLADLAAVPQRDAVDLVVIATPPADSTRLPHIVNSLQWLSADVVLRLDAPVSTPGHRGSAQVAGQPVLPLLYRPLKGSQSLVKLIEDRVIAALVLVVGSPLLLLLALAIQLDSPGPALFRQDRVGLYNRTFRIYKFRTMTVDPTDDGSKGTNSRQNPRITRVGRVLRSLSLDELPQLLNVLVGDMSIVGPRPYVRNMQVEDQTFQSSVQNFAARHRLKPGITGLAQASGMRSNALRSMTNAERSVEMDMDYITNWSLWLDLKIMVRTVTRAMSGPEVF